VQEVHALIATAVLSVLCLLLSVCPFSSGEPNNKNSNIDNWLEQEPDAMSNVTIVASIVARIAAQQFDYYYINCSPTHHSFASQAFFGCHAKV
jgi:hypothetical protein